MPNSLHRRTTSLYLALRKHDLTAEQQALSLLGLSSLGRAESHVLATLDAVITALAALSGGRSIAGAPRVRNDETRTRIEARRDSLFGVDPMAGGTRIMVTLPPRLPRIRPS
ncbi:MAG: hypothetical protein R3E48_18655 [Burkholderiaceae bacterium]